MNQIAIESVGVFHHDELWPNNLPVDDVTDDRVVKAIKENVYRQLLLQSVLLLKTYLVGQKGTSLDEISARAEKNIRLAKSLRRPIPMQLRYCTLFTEAFAEKTFSLWQSRSHHLATRPIFSFAGRSISCFRR